MSTASVVVLTMGDRPETLARAIHSIRHQSAPVEVVVVGNGCEPLVQGARVVALSENVGVAAGRNLGWREATGDIVCFLDDDAAYADDGVVAAALDRFDADPELAVLTFRIADEDGRVISKHVPMLDKAADRRVVDVTTFLGGACAIRRSELEATGGFPEDFVYALEETDLAWRVLDRGRRISYAGDLGVIHPAVATHQRAGAIRNTARNRIVLARRRLPWVLVPIYLVVRGILSLGTVRSRADLRALGSGYRDGFRAEVTDRAPMRWSTVWRMTRLGRPPVI
jgi:GT2 family glycosyltransferase